MGKVGKLVIFEIIIEDEDAELFRPGDVIKGYVRIVCAEPKKGIRGIQVKFKGNARNQWSEEEKADDDVKYTSKEKYFEVKKLLAGRDESYEGADLCLNPGEHKFPFKFNIPRAPLPDPFEGEYGHVRYKVMSKIDRPFKFDHVTQKFFSMVGVGFDLNTISEQAEIPKKDEIEKRVCCFCCESGPIKVSAETDKCGYVPGEDIWVTGFVDNQTRLSIVSTCAKLVQVVSYRAKRKGVGKEHEMTEKRKLASVEGEGCDGHDTVSFERKPIIIPACPASGLVGCSIIDIEYYIEFEADVRGTPFDASIKLPIAIGTVPLSSAFSPVSENARVVTKQPSSIHLTIPPSYEVAVGGLQEIPSKSGYDYTFGKLMYAPRYPYYNFHLESHTDEHPGHEVPHSFYGPFGPSMFGPDPHHYP